MFARSTSIIFQAAICLVSLIQANAQSSGSVDWRAMKSAPPDMVNIVDVQPRPDLSTRPSGMSRSDRKLVEPDEEVKTKFHDLLDKREFSLVKLLNVNCGTDGPMMIRANACRDSIPGHGADYSFRVGRHVFPAIADLKLNGDLLIVGSVMTQGLLVSIGKVEIGTLDNSNDAIKFLADFAPAQDAAGAQHQTLLINHGMKRDELLFGASAPVVAGATYILRTIAYRTDNDGGDRREDLTVAFTVVRLDDDGNVTLIWRELRKKESPKIKIEK